MQWVKLYRSGTVQVEPRAERSTDLLADLLLTKLLLLGQGWRDQDDADRLRYDSSFGLANGASSTGVHSATHVMVRIPCEISLYVFETRNIFSAMPVIVDSQAQPSSPRPPQNPVASQ